MAHVLAGRRVYLLAALALAVAGSLAFWLTTAGATHERSKARAAGDAIKDLEVVEVDAARKAVEQAAKIVGTGTDGEVRDRTGPDLIATTPAVVVPTAVAREDDVDDVVNTLVSNLEERYAAASAAQSRRITNARAVQGKVKTTVDAEATAALAAKDAVHAAVAGTGTLPLGTDARKALSDLMAASDNVYTKAKETQTKVGELTTAISTATAKLRTARDKARTFRTKLETLQKAVIDAAKEDSPEGTTTSANEESRIQTALVAARVARVDLDDAVTAATATTTGAVAVANVTPEAVRAAAAAAVVAVGEDPVVEVTDDNVADSATRANLRNALAVAIYRYKVDPWVLAAEHVHPTTPEPPPPPEPVEVEVEVEAPLPAAPAAATLTAPTGGASALARPVFSWQVPSGSESYRLYIATDQSFARHMVAQVGLLAANERSWVPTMALPAGTYWWRVETRTPYRGRFYQLTMSSPASFTVPAAVSVDTVTVRFQRAAKRTAIISASIIANTEGATVTVRVKNANGRTIYTAASQTLGDGERTATAVWASKRRQGGKQFTAEVTVQSGSQTDTNRQTFRTPRK